MVTEQPVVSSLALRMACRMYSLCHSSMNVTLVWAVTVLGPSIRKKLGKLGTVMP